jgi:hypothetical protein
VINPSLPRFIPKMGTDKEAAIRAERRIVPSPPILRINSVPTIWDLASSSSLVEHRHEETPREDRNSSSFLAKSRAFSRRG